MAQKLDPDAAEDYIEYLIGVGRVDDAATVLVEVVNRDRFTSKTGKSTHQLWVELCQLIAKTPEKINSIKVGVRASCPPSRTGGFLSAEED